MLDPYTFDRGMARLHANWPEKKLTEDQTALYKEMLHGLDGATFLDAVNAAIHTCEWFPKISKLIKLAGGVERAGSRPWKDVATGNAPGDNRRVVRLGEMLASPQARARAYARRMIASMTDQDREEAQRAYNQIPISVRNRMAREDATPEGVAARKAVEDEAHAVSLARNRAQAETDTEPFTPPCTLEHYLRRFIDKRGAAFRREPLTDDENLRIHSEIMDEVGFNPSPPTDGDVVGDIMEAWEVE